VSENKPIYCIDTSALIEWWVEKYSPDVFAGIPEKMTNLIAEERLFASRSVKDEIKDFDNDGELTLARWCREQDAFYSEDNEDVQAVVIDMMAKLGDYPCKPGKGIGGADPFVIAAAEIADGNCYVVSAERPSNGGPYNPNIPFICLERGIKHIDFFTLMKFEGWMLH
jgi:hypothetical protein